MGWASYETAVKELPLEVLLKKETTWPSWYNQPEMWFAYMKDRHYNLIGEYEFDKDYVLYRFELDEKFRKELPVNSSHFQNVIINRSLPKE